MKTTLSKKGIPAMAKKNEINKNGIFHQKASAFPSGSILLEKDKEVSQK